MDSFTDEENENLTPIIKFKQQKSAGSWVLAVLIEEGTSCFYFCCEIDNEPLQETMGLLGLLEIIPTYFREAKIRPKPLKIVIKAKQFKKKIECSPKN